MAVFHGRSETGICEVGDDDDGVVCLEEEGEEDQAVGRQSSQALRSKRLNYPKRPCVAVAMGLAQWETPCPPTLLPWPGLRCLAALPRSAGQTGALVPGGKVFCL